MRLDKCECDTGQCKHWSDCAVHNEPFQPNGPCDCGGYPTQENYFKRMLLENPDLSFWLLILFAAVVAVLIARWCQ